MPEEEDACSGQLAKQNDSDIPSKISEKVLDEDDVSIVDAIKELPPQDRRTFSSLIAQITSGPAPSPISKKITSEHISQLIDISEKDSQREFQIASSAEITKRWAMGAVLALVIIVLSYAGLTKDNELSEKVITAGLGVLGGAGLGYAAGKQEKG